MCSESDKAMDRIIENEKHYYNVFDKYYILISRKEIKEYYLNID